ncbi:hypothetical protein V6B33_17320 [Mangrovibacillus sp. Mu-81]|uniref:hypothetical protein n=1 Tax=Mangrovibacillus sp. Mu-81 TaxID=3121478 RepID=UPI002FE46E42
MGLLFMLPFVLGMFGLFCITIGLWELRVGIDRKKYATYMFSGFVLLFIVKFILG